MKRRPHQHRLSQQLWTSPQSKYHRFDPLCSLSVDISLKDVRFLNLRNIKVQTLVVELSAGGGDITASSSTITNSRMGASSFVLNDKLSLSVPGMVLLQHGEGTLVVKEVSDPQRPTLLGTALLPFKTLQMVSSKNSPLTLKILDAEASVAALLHTVIHTKVTKRSLTVVQSPPSPSSPLLQRTSRTQNDESSDSCIRPSFRRPRSYCQSHIDDEGLSDEDDLSGREDGVVTGAGTGAVRAVLLSPVAKSTGKHRLRAMPAASGSRDVDGFGSGDDCGGGGGHDVGGGVLESFLLDETAWTEVDSAGDSSQSALFGQSFRAHGGEGGDDMDDSECEGESEGESEGSEGGETTSEDATFDCLQMWFERESSLADVLVNPRSSSSLSSVWDAEEGTAATTTMSGTTSATFSTTLSLSPVAAAEIAALRHEKRLLQSELCSAGLSNSSLQRRLEDSEERGRAHARWTVRLIDAYSRRQQQEQQQQEEEHGEEGHEQEGLEQEEEGGEQERSILASIYTNTGRSISTWFDNTHTLRI